MDLPTPDIATPERFIKTRCDHSAESAADYAELIDDVQRAFGEVRITDLAERLGTSHVTVIQTVRRLVRDGYAVRRPYRGVFLTDAGRKLAAEARERHCVVRAVLLALGVPDAEAEHDAEGIEHHVSPATLAAFRAFLERGAGPDREGKS